MPLGIGIGLSPLVRKGTTLNQNPTTIISAILAGAIGGQNGLLFTPQMNVFSETSTDYKNFIKNLTLIN